MRIFFFRLFIAVLFLIPVFTIAAVPGVLADIGLPAGESTQVHVSIFIIDLDKINSADQGFDANVFLRYRWRDPRLAHGGTKKISRLLHEVWHPHFLIVNQQKIWRTLPEVVEIDSDGEVVYRQRVWGSFSQPLKLHNYPFDRHLFSIQLLTTGYTPKEIEIVPDTKLASGISQQLSITDWEILNFTAEPHSFKPSSEIRTFAGFAISFEAKRKTGYFIAKVFLPLILIVAMSWVVFWIDPAESGTQISVAITTMLTLIAYRFAVDAAVPKISYLTRLDYFILLSTILVYASLIEVIITSSFARREKLVQAQTIDRWMRWVFPAAFALMALKTLVF